MTGSTPPPEPPLALLAELTHRCPLRCVYCSNPLALERAGRELDTATWRRVLREAAALGVLQVHFSGGEPAVRKDLTALVAEAAACGLYTNLITSGLLLDRSRLGDLKQAGLAHVQLSVQDTDAACGDAVAGFDGAYRHKRAFAAWVKALDFALTINVVIHRHNADRVAAAIDLAAELGAGRIEVAHVQYYGWALHNRAYLMPAESQVRATTAVVAAARTRYRGVLTIDYVVPDYYARLPKACMGGWGRRFLNVDPVGRVLPCHAALTIPNLRFDTVLDRDLAGIWAGSEAFNRFRGTQWMPEPCARCERREVDWGGCRCQALALTGNAAATDPVCHKSPFHEAVRRLAETAAAADARDFAYRGGTTAVT